MNFKHLIELTDRDFTFLKKIALEERPVNILPFIAKLENEIRVKCHHALGINFVKAKRSLRLGPAQVFSV